MFLSLNFDLFLLFNSSATKPSLSYCLDFTSLELVLPIKFSFSANSSSPNVTLRINSFPFLKITNGTDSPTGVPATTFGSSFIFSISILLNFNITSPVFTPAFSAGPPSVAEETNAPFAVFIPKLSAISLEIS